MPRSRVSITARPSTGRHLLGVSFITSLESHLCTALNTQNTIENNYYFTRKKHDCSSAQCMFNWNISPTGHRQRAVGFHQRRLPRSTVNSSVTISLYILPDFVNAIRNAEAVMFCDRVAPLFYFNHIYMEQSYEHTHRPHFWTVFRLC